jgi:hypothetical protein
LPIPPRQISPRQPAQKGASASIAPSRSYRPRNAAG